LAGIYIHIPFCKSRCIYCDFYSGTNFSFLNRYVTVLCQELILRKDFLKGEKITTVYFGGGTPSVLSTCHFQQIFDALSANFDLSQCEELTLEANPDDLSDDFFQSIKIFPFNRLSVGIQSFNDVYLQFLHRRHTARQAIEAIARAKKYGFKNISIDLMYGLPDQTIGDWETTLQQALQLNVCHISAYHLIYEEGTCLWKMKEAGKVCEIDEELSVQLFEVLMTTLKANGFEHYEISNFALPHFRSRHNSSYWNATAYLGIGAAAHSYDGSCRLYNVADTQRYCEAIEQGTNCLYTEKLTKNEQYDDLIITSLRTCEGLSIDNVRNLFGDEYVSYLLQQAKPYLQNKTLCLTATHLKLSHTGIFVSDGIMSDLLRPE
jgi:putative oxygen-independent coproporphyrinogen III oxidase